MHISYIIIYMTTTLVTLETVQGHIGLKGKNPKTVTKMVSFKKKNSEAKNKIMLSGICSSTGAKACVTLFHYLGLHLHK